MKLTLIQPMADGTYRIKRLDVREKTLALNETDEVLPTLEDARTVLRQASMFRVYGNHNGEIWV
jgi:hypothetical protein